VAINEDGNDYTYFSTMKFGSQEQAMYMLIDTGSANTWVMGSGCKSKACQTHNVYNTAASTSFQTSSQKWNMAYGTGTVSGTVGSDSVQLANYTLQLGFGVANTASDDFNSYPMDGILGLGRAASDTLNSPTVMQVLQSQGHLASNVVGIHLQRASDNTNDGQITFGGIDSSKFVGKLSYSNTISEDSWQIAAGDAGVNSKGVGFQGKTATIDTGTSYILMPPADAAALHNLIEGSSQNGEQFTIPCDTSAKVYVALNGVEYSILPKDYVGKASGNGCESNIIGHQAYGPNDWIFGDVFLKSVYSVFDYDKAQVGFGTKAGNGAPAAGFGSSSSATPSTTSSAAASGSATAKPTSSAGGDTSSRPATTMATATTKSHSSTATASAATATSSGPNSSDPFTQSGNGGPSSSSTNDGSLSPPRPILAAMVLAFVVGLLL
jgi:cathepsin D